MAASSLHVEEKRSLRSALRLLRLVSLSRLAKTSEADEGLPGENWFCKQCLFLHKAGGHGSAELDLDLDRWVGEHLHADRCPGQHPVTHHLEALLKNVRPTSGLGAQDDVGGPARPGLATYLQDAIHARRHLGRVRRDVVARHLGHSSPRLGVSHPSGMRRSQRLDRSLARAV